MVNWNRVVVCFIFIFTSILVCGQEEKSQELINMLNNGDYFKSKELYQQICNDISPEIDLYYKFQMSKFLNQEDSAAIFLENIYDKYPNLFGNNTMDMYGILLDTYVNLINKEKGVYTYNRMMKYLQENPYNLSEDELILWKDGTENRLCYLKYLTSLPPIKLERRKENLFAKIKGNDRLLVEMKFNGIKRTTYLDTGCDFYYIMNRKEAEMIGLKCELSEMTKSSINNSDILMKHVLIDSIEIGNIILYNIPAVVYENDITPYLPDSVKNDPEKKAYVDSQYSHVSNSSIGLPVMKLIGKFLINYKNKKITFPTSDYLSFSIEEPNMFFYNSDLYTRLKLNEKNFIGTLDIGLDEYMKVDTLFYEKYKSEIPLDTTFELKDSYNIMMIHQIWNGVSYKVPYKPQLVFNNNKMRVPTKEAIKIYSLRPIWFGEYFDGVIGYNFFKRIGRKVLLDFSNMRLEAIK